MCQGLSKKGKKSLISNLFPRFIHDLMKKKRKIQNIPITVMQHLYFYCRLSVKIMNAARQFKVNRQNLRKASDCRYTDQWMRTSHSQILIAGQPSANRQENIDYSKGRLSLIFPILSYQIIVVFDFCCTFGTGQS